MWKVTRRYLNPITLIDDVYMKVTRRSGRRLDAKADLLALPLAGGGVEGFLQRVAKVSSEVFQVTDLEGLRH